MSSRGRNIMILAAGLLAIGVLWGISIVHFDIPLCPFKVLTGLPCPGCGGVRVFRLLCDGHALRALMLNPLSIMLILFLALSILWLIADIIRNRQSYISFMTRRWPRSIVIAIIAVIALNWLWNIYKDI